MMIGVAQIIDRTLKHHLPNYAMAVPGASSGAYTRLPRHKENLKVTASAIPRNLAILESGDKRKFAVAHRSSVCVLIREQDSATVQQSILQPFPSDAEGQVDSRTFITELKWCQLQCGRVLLVMASFSGFVVVDNSNDDILLHYRLSSSTLEFIRGITSIQNSLCVGSSDGTILVFTVSGRKVEYLQQLQQLHGYRSAVCDLESLGDGRLASSHEDGSIIIWNNPLKSGDESRVEIQQPQKVVCVCLSSWKEVLVGGFSDGSLKLYSSNRGEKLVEIAAHGRWINTVDIAKTQGLLLSASEDGTASVWKLTGGKAPKVSLLFSTAVDNVMLCGGKFWGNQGQGFALTAYDNDRIVEYSRT